MKRAPLAVAALYAVFAAAAAAVNLGTQWAVAGLWPWGLPSIAALIAGTGAGLLVKYILDKRWIFRAMPMRLAADARRFLQYCATGLVTTALFWGIELSCIAAFGAAWGRYAGGAAGLCAGYSLKYLLDRRIVFAGASSRTNSIDGRTLPGAEGDLLDLEGREVAPEGSDVQAPQPGSIRSGTHEQ